MPLPARFRPLYLLTLAAIVAPACTSSPVESAGGHIVRPLIETDAVPNDPDDPAIWIHPTDPSRSLIIGTDKIERVGGVYVFSLDGAMRQAIAPLDRPNNVDVEYGMMLGGSPADIAVVTERKQHRLRVFRIAPDGSGLEDVSAGGGIPVLESEKGEAAEPMGIALYKRPADGTVFAIVSPKTGNEANYLWHYRLEDDGAGMVKGTFVRRFGRFSRIGAEPGDIGEIEAIVVDDGPGYVYYSDERFGIRKYHADPDHPDAALQLAAIGREGYEGDREGLGIYADPGGSGVLVSVDQIPGRSRLRLYHREGATGNPHDHQVVREVTTASDSTDGLAVTSTPLPGFPSGLVVMMNSRGRNFHLYRWEDVHPR